MGVPSLGLQGSVAFVFGGILRSVFDAILGIFFGQRLVTGVAIRQRVLDDMARDSRDTRDCVRGCWQGVGKLLVVNGELMATRLVPASNSTVYSFILHKALGDVHRVFNEGEKNPEHLIKILKSSIWRYCSKEIRKNHLSKSSSRKRAKAERKFRRESSGGRRSNFKVILCFRVCASHIDIYFVDKEVFIAHALASRRHYPQQCPPQQSYLYWATLELMNKKEFSETEEALGQLRQKALMRACMEMHDPSFASSSQSTRSSRLSQQTTTSKKASPLLRATSSLAADPQTIASGEASLQPAHATSPLEVDPQTIASGEASLQPAHATSSLAADPQTIASGEASLQPAYATSPLEADPQTTASGEASLQPAYATSPLEADPQTIASGEASLQPAHATSPLEADPQTIASGEASLQPAHATSPLEADPQTIASGEASLQPAYATSPLEADPQTTASGEASLQPAYATSPLEVDPQTIASSEVPLQLNSTLSSEPNNNGLLSWVKYCVIGLMTLSGMGILFAGLKTTVKKVRGNTATPPPTDEDTIEMQERVMLNPTRQLGDQQARTTDSEETPLE